MLIILMVSFHEQMPKPNNISNSPNGTKSTLQTSHSSDVGTARLCNSGQVEVTHKVQAPIANITISSSHGTKRPAKVPSHNPGHH